MAEIREDNEPFDDINITPMLDLAYVLLVIFIIMTTASVQGIKVNLPKASNTPSLAKPKTKSVTIDANGAKQQKQTTQDQQHAEPHQAQDQVGHHRRQRTDLPGHVSRQHGRTGKPLEELQGDHARPAGGDQRRFEDRL